MYDVITVGAATYDIFLRSRDFSIVEAGQYLTGRAECVPLGAKIEVKDITFATGGGATNAAVSFSRKGLKTAAVIRVGTDAAGREVVADLAKEGVITSFVQETHRSHTGHSVLMVTLSGERSVLVYRGASSHLSIGAIDWENCQARNYYVSSVGGDIELLETVFSKAKSQKARVAWNPGSRELHHGLQGLRKILKQADILIINQEEAAMLTGLPLEDTSNMLSVIRRVTEGVILLTRGSEGALVLDGKYLFNAGIFKEKERLDRTGAGDAFGSGFVAGLILDRDNNAEALRIAASNATSVVEHIGAKAGLLNIKQLKERRWQKLSIERRLFN